MNRSTGLSRATEAARKFMRRGQESSARSLGRSRRISVTRKPRDTELTLRAARLQEAFRLAGLQQGCCQSCGYRGPFVEVHHAISRSLLKRLLLKKGEPVAPEVLWDPENALLLCEDPAPNRCHSRHTLAMRRVPRRALRSENWAFARRHDLEWVLITEYPLEPTDRRRPRAEHD